VQREMHTFLKKQTNKCGEALTSRLPRFGIQVSQAMYKMRGAMDLMRNWRVCVGAPPNFQLKFCSSFLHHVKANRFFAMQERSQLQTTRCCSARSNSDGSYVREIVQHWTAGVG